MKPRLHKAYILLGSNQNKPAQQLKKAIRHIEKFGEIDRISSIYQTAAWGLEDQPDFLNQIVILQTHFNAEELMQQLLKIESKMGRVRTIKNAPRTIDLDILFFDKELHHLSNLIVPHPRIQDRRFVLIPMNELSPNFIHPVLKKTVHTLLKTCKDNLDVKRI